VKTTKPAVANVGVPHEYPDLTTTDCQPGHAMDITIRACSDIIARYPTFAMAYAVRGNAYRNYGERENALSDLSTAIELDPQNTFALARRFVVFSSIGEERKGQADIDRLIATRERIVGIKFE
jgi:tetratricopeptide (TPR) repeat protein